MSTVKDKDVTYNHEINTQRQVWFKRPRPIKLPDTPPDRLGWFVMAQCSCSNTTWGVEISSFRIFPDVFFGTRSELYTTIKDIRKTRNGIAPSGSRCHYCHKTSLVTMVGACYVPPKTQQKE